MYHIKMLRRRSKYTLILFISVIALSLYYFIPTSVDPIPKNTHFIHKLKLKNQDQIPLDTKCSNYFKHYIDNDISYQHSDYIFEETLDDYLKKQIDKFPSYSKNQYNSWKSDHKDHINSYLKIEQNLVNQTIDTRIFNSCFLQPEHVTLNGQCDTIQRKLFPWLSFKSPKIININGVENIDPQSECFIQGLYQQATGKGIVISAKNSHYQQLSSLFLSLRVLNNTLPIQIIHRGDFSRSRQLQLTRLARIDYSRLIQENSEYIKYITSQPNYNETLYKYSTYPKIDVQFINIYEAIDKHYLKTFKQYTNKLLAALFTTFKEVIIMDADIILFNTPESLFNIQEYITTGAFFFKDRQLINRSSPQDKEFWKRLMPTMAEHEFNPKITLPQNDLTFNNRYFKGFTHLVEAGIVIMDRSTHFSGILHSIQLSLWKTATKRVWGDKELFWLSQAISGTQSFSFNSNAAGAVGELSKDSTINQSKICSNQPVHIYNDSLLWINSGFKYCKNGGAKKDLKYFPSLDMSQLVDKYKGPLNISFVVIPPDVDEIYLHWSGEMQNQEPNTREQGWYNTPMCAGYTYCAVSELEVDGKIYKGKVLKFNEQESLDYNYLGTLWLGANELQKCIDRNKKELVDYLDVEIQ